MSKEELKIGEISKPRFEFRSFGQDFEEAHFRMARLSMPVPEKVWERYSEEIYILSRTNDINNTKIRDGKMDIKTFVQSVDGLEQWNPLMKGEFPIKASVLKNEVFPAFQVDMPELTKDVYTYDEFMEIIKNHRDLQAVRVNKERYGFMVNNTICEYGLVWINGALVVTINSESTEVEDIKKTVKELGLEGVENINYLQAIKRVIGMIDKPLANE
jgi:ribosomal protein L30/L7E